jgi:hypothetical protein
MDKHEYLTTMAGGFAELLRWLETAHLPHPGPNLTDEQEEANMAFLQGLDARGAAILQKHVTGVEAPVGMEELHAGILACAHLPGGAEGAIHDLVMAELTLTCEEAGVPFPEGDAFLDRLLALAEELEREQRN